MELMHIILGYCLFFPLVISVNVSKEELVAMEKYLKSINKPAIVSIHSEYGDIFDCVDINKQPAFDHPALKDHKIQMTPSIFPKEEKVNGSQLFTNHILGLPGGGCPNGTVPIRRVKIEELIRAGSVLNFGKKYGKDSLDDQFTKHRYATIENKTPGNYTGAAVWMNVWNPATLQRSQFSLSQLWIAAGSGDDLNTIEAGWMVYGDLYADLRPRFFVFWTGKNYKSGCYNLMCPGFVQISKLISVGWPTQDYSTYDGNQYDVKFVVVKDPATGDWWLSLGEEPIGYWPRSLFTVLQKGAEYVQFGGEVYNQYTDNTWPEMGSGHFAQEGYQKACYMRDARLLDSENNFNPLPLDAVSLATGRCYSFVDKGIYIDGRKFYFGGPGGDDC